MISDILTKFKHQLFSTEKEQNLIFNFYYFNLFIDSYAISGINEKEKYRSSENLIEEIFPENFITFHSLYSSEFKKTEKEERLIENKNDDEIIYDIAPFPLENLKLELNEVREHNTPVKKSEQKLLEEEQKKLLLNQSIRNSIELNLKSKRNMEEFKIQTLSSEIKEAFGSPTKSNLNFKFNTALTFYNTLIISQEKKLFLKQKKPFDSLYIINI
jgi:hypothetical protein